MEIKQVPALAAHTMNDIRTHAIGQYPSECCGLIIKGQFIAKKNIAPNPLTSYQIDQNEWSDDIEAVVHSHPDVTDAIPSGDDIKYMIGCNVPFGIIPVKQGWAGELRWIGDYTLELSLVGRQSIHGITDCYSLLRAHFWQKHRIYLKDFPRNADWWYSDEPNLYLQGFQEAGFKQVTDDIQEDDVLLMKLLPKTKGPHHCGVVLNNSLLLHHWGSELSRRTPIGPWLRHTTHRVRYVK